MDRRIVLDVAYDGICFTIQIVEQTHRCSTFGNPDCDFTSSTGLMLSSCTCPAAHEEDNVVYVRGDDPHANRQCINVDSIGFMQRIMHAVREYNTYARSDKLPDVPTDVGTFIVE